MVNFFLEEFGKVFLFLRSLKNDSITFGDFIVDTLKTHIDGTTDEKMLEAYSFKLQKFLLTTATTKSK